MGLDWNPMRRPKAGHKAAFRAYIEARVDTRTRLTSPAEVLRDPPLRRAEAKAVSGSRGQPARA